MHTKLPGVLSIALLMLGVAGAASAGDTPCREDAVRLCGDIEPGEGRLQACLETKKDEVSADCRMRMVKVKAELKRGEKACGDDALRFCADVEPGKGRVAQCLAENESQLTPDCQAWTANTRKAVKQTGDEIKGGFKRLKAIKGACGSDVEKFCSDVPEGKGRRVKCLESNRDAVSADCQAALG